MKSLKLKKVEQISFRGIVKDFYYKLRNLLRCPSDKFNHNSIHFSTRISKGASLKLCKVGKYNYIARDGIYYNTEVGNYCCFGPNVHVGGMQHSYWWYSMSPLLSDKAKPALKTCIGNDVWIGAQSVICQGIIIGDGAVIGANSFVNKNVPPFAIVVGSPAKILKYRFDEDISNKILDSRYWDYDVAEAKRILSEIK